MDLHILFMILGFSFAAYSVVGNDVIQTLGTFISSNGKTPWYLLWAYTGIILISVLFYGWYSGQGVAYGRLNNIPFPEVLQWWHVLPPLVLLIITRFGIPVSTTFLVLSVFATKNITSMVTKSALGYLVAFVFAIVVYLFVSRFFEENFIKKEIKKNEKTNLDSFAMDFYWFLVVAMVDSGFGKYLRLFASWKRPFYYFFHSFNVYACSSFGLHFL